jgi:serine-type D-Ala-D-Ala carboxypeptidase/endopeptidase (penicillin-binding protein 4)
MRSFSLGSSLVLAALVLPGCTVTEGAQLTRLLSAYDDHPVQVSVLVKDLDTGEVVLSRDAQRLFRPASTQKLLTTAAICRRDPDGTFVTSLSASALPAGVVTMIGDGDPLLSTEDVRAMARDLHANGLANAVAEVRIVDAFRDAPRFGEGWMWDDEPDPFLPSLSAACVDAGCVTVAITEEQSQLRAKLDPVAGELRLSARAGAGDLRVGRGRYRDPDLIEVTGKLRDGEPTRRRVTVPVPARFTGHVLTDALGRAGVPTQGCQVAVVTDAPEASSRQGEVVLRRSVADVVINTNKVSDNLGAEMLLRRLGSLQQQPASLDDGAAAAGIAAIEADLRQLGCEPSTFRIADGSGVSHYNLLSADLLVKLLVDMQRRGGRGLELFRESLPIGGQDGTLAGRMKGGSAAGRVHAKTGTISAVSNLAGYIDTRSGRRFAFAVMCQNYVGSARPWRELQDQVCAVLADM